MRTDQGSRTAIYVALGRAAAQGRTAIPRFDDPVAASLIPEAYRESLERIRDGKPPRSRRERFLFRIVHRMVTMMPVRTVAIDDGMRERLPVPQVVLLGAGLDARAWRMPELASSIVFEVDHPATQAVKKERIGNRAPTAREIRFVSIDFQTEKLDDALSRHGHDPARPTVWIWEGVVSYLAPAAVEATLDVVSARSAPGSRLLATYNPGRWSPQRLVTLVYLRAIGEPFLSAHRADQMRALLESRGFLIASDMSLAEHARRLGAKAGERRWGSHGRLVAADRAPALSATSTGRHFTTAVPQPS